MSAVNFPAFRLRVNAAGPAPTFPSWRQGMAVLQWKEIPGLGANLKSVEYLPRPKGNTVFFGKVSENGFTIRKADSTLIRWGGGHLDYAGNEVDAIKLEADAPAWQQVCTPTPNDQVVGEVGWWGTDPNDLKPNPPHTYHSLQFIEASETLLCVGRTARWASGGQDRETVGFDWTTKKWRPPGTFANAPMYTNQAGYLNVCQDGTGRGVYVLNRNWGTLFHWTIDNPVFKSIASSNVVTAQGGITYDTLRNRILRFGFFGDDGNSFYVRPPRTIDIATGANTDRTFVGTPEITAELLLGRVRHRTGMVYDAQMDRYLIHAGVNGRIIQVHPETWEATVLPTTGGESITNAHFQACNRFVYVPNLKGYVYLPTYNDNLWFLATE